MVSKTTEVVYAYLPGDMTGVYDRVLDIIIIDPRCDPATRRSTEAHERVHAERGDSQCEDHWFDAKQERIVELEAARRLIPVHLLEDGLRWCSSHPEELAHYLDVDLDMLHARIETLTDEEKFVLERTLRTLERGA
ncbi:hypothetical protein LJ753_11055 [Arthrobacter sp. zg-Y20]|uniref:hypothetical protein n=1 Tax=unclassified Arthrobacter TaxID=235627 RepID=UPI001D135DD0|nr:MULTISPECIES: hypothetical protein [unclassified Arthrobacter]MCC3276408.1 hypothetical protein [Arthrobacter sp. zg-Y20]MDK1316567.1 hypothetical protein [Arthrobacter sp. zg.Y20]WIB06607.1 hypothetical protein QNO06_02355 [Arthrobacter sp. zg-Y20]